MQFPQKRLELLSLVYPVGKAFARQHLHLAQQKEFRALNVFLFTVKKQAETNSILSYR